MVGVINDGEGTVVGRIIAVLRSTAVGDAGTAVLSPPQAEANKNKAVAESITHRYVPLEKLVSVVCILLLQSYACRSKQYNKVSARLDENRLREPFGDGRDHARY